MEHSLTTSNPHVAERFANILSHGSLHNSAFGNYPAKFFPTYLILWALKIFFPLHHGSKQSSGHSLAESRHAGPYKVKYYHHDA